ncbi:MAG: uncharacterized membrane protein YkvA (DUF1232 family) [Halieaceae bacterium]
MEDSNSNYSEVSFWDKVKSQALMAGREVIEKALVLYYCLQDQDTPTWAKTIILSALAYFVLPADAIPDYLVGVGFTDDLGALAAAAMTVASHIKEGHSAAAADRVLDWFGDGKQDASAG